MSNKQEGIQLGSCVVFAPDAQAPIYRHEHIHAGKLSPPYTTNELKQHMNRWQIK